MMNKLPIVGVMGSGTKGWDSLALTLGEALAGLDVHLLTGAGAGVMTTVSKGFTDVTPRKGFAIGIVPTEKSPENLFVARQGYPNPYIEIPIYTPLGIYAGDGTDFISRNHANILTANAIIALPGSGGTRNEINLAALFGKPLCLLGPHDLASDFHPLLPRMAEVADAIKWLETQLQRTPVK